MYNIQTNVPLVEIRRRQAAKKAAEKRYKYPFLKMNVGDSFSVPHDQTVNMRAAVIGFQRQYNAKFVTRSLGKKTRCWRVA